MFEHIEKIQPGWELVGSDERHIGDVNRVEDDHLQTTTGIVFPRDLYVPAEAIDGIDPDGGRVYLTVSTDDVDRLGWAAPPGSAAIGPAR